MYERILLPVNRATPPDSVIDHVLEHATHHDADVHILHVVNGAEVDAITGRGTTDVDSSELPGGASVEETAEAFDDLDAEVTQTLVTGDAVREIANYADSEGIDIIVMGTHRRTGINRLIVGSVTEKVIRKCDIPVLAV